MCLAYLFWNLCKKRKKDENDFVWSKVSTHEIAFYARTS